jgi:hypothetical protein
LLSDGKGGQAIGKGKADGCSECSTWEYRSSNEKREKEPDAQNKIKHKKPKILSTIFCQTITHFDISVREDGTFLMKQRILYGFFAQCFVTGFGV